MGVPFNFTCIGVGTYVCSRCGFELFPSDAKIVAGPSSSNSNQASAPVQGPLFTKAVNSRSIIRIPIPGADSPNSASMEVVTKIACGKCGIHLGFEQLIAGAAEGEARSSFSVPSRHLRFVQANRCAVPLSFLF